MSTATAPAASPRPPVGSADGTLARVGRALRTLALGAFACQLVPAAVVFLGWTLRRSRRGIVLQWWQQAAPDRRGASFEGFCAASSLTRGLATRPALIFAEGERGLARSWPRALGANFALGAKAWLNAALLTLPAVALWSFGWRIGWDDSFRKSYEQASAGPLIGLLGTALFVLAMLHLPLAQARQALTGRWRDFWDVRLVSRLRRSRPVASAALALAWSAAAFPFLVLRVAPLGAGNAVGAPADVTAEEARRLLGGYFLVAALVIVVTFVATRMLAGRLYAVALRSEVRAGRIATDELAPVEAQALERLGLLDRIEPPPRSALARVLAWTGGRALAWTTGAVACVLWFTLAAQVFVAQFFLYLPLVGWWNHPLVQLPWFRYVPAGS